MSENVATPRKIATGRGKRVMADGSSSPTTRISLLVRLRDPADAEAWQTFVDVYAPLVYSYCRRKGLQEADASDVTQEVLTEVARSIPGFTYDSSRGRFRDWLGTLARRRLQRFFAARNQAPQAGGGGLDDVAAADLDGDWAETFHARVLQVALERARPHFEPTTWRAFELVWLENRAPNDVAAEVGVPIEKVYVAKSRALKALRQLVLDLADDLPLPGIGD
jgi:RNA polymerase sigma-70 factor (ECF subfamily)